LRPYVASGSKFVVIKINGAHLKKADGSVTPVLSPLRFEYESDDLRLPVRLGLINSSGTQDLIVNILSRGGPRYEVANYPNVMIPTNLDVREEFGFSFDANYAAFFDRTLAKHPHAFVTEYVSASTFLDSRDLATLGADVLPGKTPFTLTRLHALS